MPRRAKELQPAARPRTAPAGKRERPAKAVLVESTVEMTHDGRVMRNDRYVVPELVVPQFTNTTTFVPHVEWMESVTEYISMTSTVWTNWIIQAQGIISNATGSVTATYSGTGSTAHVVWQQWCDDEAPGVAFDRAVLGAARGRVSPEERARRDAEARLWQEQREAQAAARKEANRKAEVLLRSVLTPDQIRDLESRACFFMRDKNGLLYRIDRGQHGNVKLLDDKQQVVESYCIQPRGGLPDADAMVAQKLMLQTDPETFRRVANITRNGRVIMGQPLP